MSIYGDLRCFDKPSTFQAYASTILPGILQCIDSTTFSPITGYIVISSTVQSPSLAFNQDSVLGPGDLTLTFMDRTYTGGYWVDSTYIDSTLWRVNRLFDPIWINYAIWYMAPPDASDGTLIGYRYRDPVNPSVGNYYASMVTPDPAGQYQIRWVYQKDDSSYAKEIVQNFVSVSNGLSNQVDYS